MQQGGAEVQKEEARAEVEKEEARAGVERAGVEREAVRVEHSEETRQS